VQQYTASIPFDQRLYRQDIAGSMAHAKMLAKQDVISESVVMLGYTHLQQAHS